MKEKKGGLLFLCPVFPVSPRCSHILSRCHDFESARAGFRQGIVGHHHAPTQVGLSKGDAELLSTGSGEFFKEAHLRTHWPIRRLALPRAASASMPTHHHARAAVRSVRNAAGKFPFSTNRSTLSTRRILHGPMRMARNDKNLDLFHRYRQPSRGKYPAGSPGMMSH